MQEDVYTAVKESQLKLKGSTDPDQYDNYSASSVFIVHTKHTVTADRKDTVGLHVTVNDVLCMQIAENEGGGCFKNQMTFVSFYFGLSEKFLSLGLTPCPEQSAWQCL